MPYKLTPSDYQKPRTPSAANKFVLSENSPSKASDNWVAEIGKKETQLLPSGAMLLTGNLAEEKALQIAKAAWPPKNPQGMADNGHGRIVKRLPAISLEQTLLSGKTLILGMWNNIILTTKAPLGKKKIAEKEKQNLLLEAVRSLEQGAALGSTPQSAGPGKELLNKAKGEHYPLVINVNQNGITIAESAEANDFISMVVNDAGKSFIRNYDLVTFATRVATVTKNGEIVPPWSDLFHEIVHVGEYDEFRKKYLARFEGMVNPFPKGNWIKGADNKITTYKIDKKINSKSAIPDHEHRAIAFQKILCELARVPFRTSYDDIAKTVLVNDPIESKPIK